MDPVAFEIGPLTIRWYGIFVALGFLAAFYYSQYRAGKLGFARSDAADLAFLGIVGGLFGGRLLYVLQNWRYYSGNWLEIVRVDHGGLVFYGGLFGGLGFVLLGCWKKRCSVWFVADIFAPALALGHGFGRVGCFLNGCCFGVPWAGLGGAQYPAAGPVSTVQAAKGLLADAHRLPHPVFPVQLLLAVMNFLICVILVRSDKRLRHRGEIVGLYLILYAAGRFLVEFLRGDYLRTLGVLTPAQVICLVIGPVGFLLWWIRHNTGELKTEDEHAG